MGCFIYISNAVLTMNEIDNLQNILIIKLSNFVCNSKILKYDINPGSATVIEFVKKFDRTMI